MGSAVSAVSNFASSALGLGRGGNVSGQGYIDDTNSLAAENARMQLDQAKALNQQQTDFGKMLADRAMGKAPSIATAQMKQAQDRNLKQQLAAAKSNRAVNPALAFRQVQKLGADGAQQIAQASGIAKMQEDLANQAMFGNYLGQQQQNVNNSLGTGQKTAESLFAAQTGKRNSDINMTGNIMNQVGSMAAMMSDKKVKTDIKDASTKKTSSPRKNYSKGGLAGDGKAFYTPRPGQMFSDILAAKPAEEQQAGSQFGSFGQMLESLMSQQSGGMPMAGGPMDSMGAAGAGAVPVMVANQGGKVPGPEVVSGDSIENDIIDAKLSAGEMVIPKTVVQKGPKAVEKFAAQQEEKQFNPKSFLDALKPYSYKYKNPEMGAGRQMSVMAQDLEKAGPVGRSMVEKTPSGKMVNYGKGFGAILASAADLNQRMNQIEAKYGGKKA
jgi:hypothetical protein